MTLWRFSIASPNVVTRIFLSISFSEVIITENIKKFLTNTFYRWNTLNSDSWWRFKPCMWVQCFLVICLTLVLRKRHRQLLFLLRAVLLQHDVKFNMRDISEQMLEYGHTFFSLFDDSGCPFPLFLCTIIICNIEKASSFLDIRSNTHIATCNLKWNASQGIHRISECKRDENSLDLSWVC